jgi:hypothetical protein
LGCAVACLAVARSRLSYTFFFLGFFTSRFGAFLFPIGLTACHNLWAKGQSHETQTALEISLR